MSKRLSACMTLAIAAAFATPALGQSLQDRYWIEASGYRPGIDTTLTVSRPGAPGTEVDVESDLGLNKRETLPAFLVGARFWERFQVVGEYYALDRNGSRTISRDIVFDGSTYPASASLDSKLGSNIYRATLGYAFLRRPRGELGAAVGLHATDFEFRIRGEARLGSGALQSETRRRNFLAPLPTVGLFATYEPAPKVILNGRVDYLSMEVGDYDGGILNAQASAAYAVTDHLQVGLVYRYVAYDLDIEKPDYTAAIDYDFSGPSVFLRLAFR